MGGMKHVGGHGGERVSAECCLHPHVLKDYLFVSINKDRGGMNGELLYHSRGTAQPHYHIHAHTLCLSTLISCV